MEGGNTGILIDGCLLTGEENLLESGELLTDSDSDKASSLEAQACSLMFSFFLEIFLS
jgi:hypothetical protein